MDCVYASNNSWMGQKRVWVSMRMWVSNGKEAGLDGVRLGVEQQLQ